MVTVQEIYGALDGWAPFAIQMDFDNAGLLVGDKKAQVRRVLLALDATLDVVKEASRKRCQLIVTHHPLIFHPLRAVRPDDPTQAAVAQLVRKNIALICAHTNLDQVGDGVSRALMDALGAETKGIFQERGYSEGHPEAEALGPYGLGCWGELPEAMEPQAFARHVKKALGTCSVRAVLGDRPVKKIAVCGGAGSDMVELAARMGFDAYVSADAKHHEFLAAKALGLTFLDAGHFATENPVMAGMQRWLTDQFGPKGVEFLLSAQKEPYRSV